MSSNVTTTTPASKTAVWGIDPAHTSIDFSVKHLMISTVTGRFQTVRGTVELDEDDFTNSRIEAEIDAASITTGVSDRDNHLRSPDFFDVENHPTLRFQSREVQRKGDDNYVVIGDLTIRGVTQEVALDVEYAGQATDPWGARRIVAEATGTVNRKDFGLNYNQALDTGGWLVGDKIKIALNVQAVAPSQ